MADPFEAWQRRRREKDSTAGIVELYQLAAKARGISVEQLTEVDRKQLWSRALPVLEPGYEVIHGSDRAEQDSIEVVPYDGDWPAQFEAWKAKLFGVLEGSPRIEHVGSTSVPGLPAKPVIDIQVSVPDISDESAYVPPIESIGIQFRSRDDQHRYFRPFSGLPRSVQVHVCNMGSEWERRHLLFRDFLRADTRAKDEYLAVKRQAAVLWRDDRIAYADAKTEVIERLMRRARVWKRS